MIAIQSFQPPGPVAAAFINSTERINGIMGPMRSGKTTTALYKRLVRAMSLPICKDGNRHYSFLLVRDSYGALYDTTIRSWHELFPKDVGKWNGTEGRPANHELRFDMPEGGSLYFRARFVSVQNDTIENLTRGTEFTDIVLEEADLLPESLVTYCNGRIAQFPKKAMLPDGAKASGLIDVVTNPPDVENWFYRRFVEEMLPMHALFMQPSGLSNDAENIANIPEGREYYRNLAATNPKWWVDRMVHGKFGASRSAEAVYRDDYDDVRHCGNRIIKPADAPLLLGFDQNLVNPACTITQWMPSGQWRTIEEIVPGRMGAFAFGGFVRDFLNRELRGLPVSGAWIDPSTVDGADTEHGELSYFEGLKKGLGMSGVQIAPTQEPSARQDSLRQMLRAPDILLPTGEKVTEFALSAKCRMLRKGFISHYRFRKQRNDPNAPLMPDVDKNQWSDPMDAEQYKALGARGMQTVIANVRAVPRYQPRGGAPRAKLGNVRPGDFNVWET